MDEHLDELQTLPNTHRTLFAASCAERLIPNYRAFYLMENWGQPEVLERALEYVYSSIEEGSWENEFVTQQIQACQELAPDSENFSTLFTGAAINAAGAVFYALKSLSEDSIDHARYAGQVAINTVYDYLYEMSNPSLSVRTRNPNIDVWLSNAPLLIAEIGVQRDIISLLHTKTAIDKNLLLIIRQMTSVAGIRPFERGLIKP